MSWRGRFVEDDPMSRNVLVTGGAGFIGSHICQRLLDRGDEVMCLDSFGSDYDPALKRSNIATLIARAGFDLIEGDIRDKGLLGHIAQTRRIDSVIHLAARTGVRASMKSPAEYADVNFHGTAQILEMARDHSIDNFIFASSSSVYGERTETPFKESDPVNHPASPYAATKCSGEILCRSFQQLFGINISCLRYFTVYGPRQRPGMAIHRFCSLISQGEPVPMYGDGSSERDYTYIDDIVDGTLLALDRCNGFDIFNLGNHHSIRLDQLIAAIGRSCGVDYSVETEPVQSGDVSRTYACLEKSHALLGYQPKVALEQGLDRFVEWLTSHDQKTIC
ncbi:MAG: epimerase [Planctomycetes bacterium]|nr:epimerase [Planctomycetota bacterium]